MSFDVTKPLSLTRLLFGGTFNPIHTGHLLVARAVAEAAGCGRVVLVPSAQPPHKPRAAELAAAKDRSNMCQAVAKGDSFFEVTEIELNRHGPSYTFDTVQELKRAGETEIAWLIGADMLQILPTWHRAAELLKMVRFVVVRRPGYVIDWDELPAEFSELRNHVVDAPLLEISATEIRQRVRDGKSIRYLTPPAVEQYIEERGLYRG
jgi:nicotinate-nucleotide adenylyltransferase